MQLRRVRGKTGAALPSTHLPCHRELVKENYMPEKSSRKELQTGRQAEAEVAEESSMQAEVARASESWKDLKLKTASRLTTCGTNKWQSFLRLAGRPLLTKGLGGQVPGRKGAGR